MPLMAARARPFLPRRRYRANHPVQGAERHGDRIAVEERQPRPKANQGGDHQAADDERGDRVDQADVARDLRDQAAVQE